MQISSTPCFWIWTINIGFCWWLFPQSQSPSKQINSWISIYKSIWTSSLTSSRTGVEIWEHWGGKQLTWHHHTEDTKVLSLAMIQGEKRKKKSWSYLHLFSNGIKDGNDAGQATADCNADYKCQGDAEDHKEDIKCQKHDAKPADPVCNSWWTMIEEHLSAI